MQLSKPKLFLSILTFMLIVNLLVIFDINQFYIRAILAFVFIITIPGLLIMLCLKIRNIGFWEYLVYTIGLSVSFIMFAGLAVNWILPWLNVTDKPLSLYPILICFDTILLILWLVAHKRNYDLKLIIQFPKFSWLDRIFILWALCFPFMAVVGAFLLNNHGTNIVTMTMLGMIALYVLLIVIFRDKLNENVFPWALWMISIALLSGSWLRSDYISGIDINEEYSIFQITKNVCFWNLASFREDYNAMLSITIFPTIQSLFLKINEQYIFKLVSPLIFSITSLIIYLLSKKYTEKEFSFLAVFFFVSQPMFIVGGLGIPVRQQIAFIFFSLMFLVLFSKEINHSIKKFLFVIFGFSMIVSHYSTAYIAIAIFLLTYIMTFFCKIWESRKIKKGKLKHSEKQKFYLTGLVILLLLIFGFLWYSQVTPTANGLIDFMHRSFSNMENMFSEDVQLQGQSIFKQLNILEKSEDPYLRIEDSTNEIIKDYKEKYPSPDFYGEQTYQNYSIQIKSTKGLENKFNTSIVSEIYNLREKLKMFGELFIVIGVFYFLLYQLKKNNTNREFIIIILSSFIILSFIVILPFASINYDFGRTYQQMLVILSLPAVMGILFIFKFLKEKYRIIAIVLFFIFYFLFLSKYTNQIVGGYDISMGLNNLGFEYNTIYTHKTEVYSGNWLFKDNDKKNLIYADNFAYDKILLLIPPEFINNIVRTILPPIIRREDYVYLSYNNFFNNIAFKPYKRIMLSYNYPIEFLNDNKNLIYNNGGSEIFK